MESLPASLPTNRKTVLIIADQTAIRERLAVLVRSLTDFELIDQAASREEAAQLAGDLRPDVVVLDWMFPDGSGADFLTQLKKEARQTEVLVFSATASPHAVREALTGGAKGFVEKGASAAELTQALRAVAIGRVYFGPAIARTLDSLVRRRPKVETTLSERECAVLGLIAEGLSSKQIAVRLGLSIQTVNNLRSVIAAKTGLHSIARLTAHAMRLGLVPGPNDGAGSELEEVPDSPPVAASVSAMAQCGAA